MSENLTKLVTYPPELLPMPDEDDEVEIFVCEDHHDEEGPCPNCRKVKQP
jgi:hypothetical protein